MNFGNIPEELKQLNRWVCWKLVEREGKATKVPVNPMTGGQAMSNNPDTWSDYWTAHDKMMTDGYPGIGFMFNGDGILGVDIDHCKDPETGKLSDLAMDIIQTIDSYTEFSQSGAGIHIICKGKLPEGRRRKEPVEMYETGRFFVMTGNILDDAHTDIEERTEQLAIVHEKYINVKKTRKSESKTPVFVNESSKSDDELIEIALNAKNGDLFAQLMDGNWKGRYSSQSEADIALCNLLAFYTRCDAAQMQRIFCRSGLFREKWNERRGEGTYGEITINRAIADCTETYKPPAPKSKPKQKNVEPPDIDLGLDQLTESAPPPDAQASKYDMTSDLGRSKRFSEKYRDRLHWCEETKSWLVWNGKYWDVDRTLVVNQMAKEIVNEFLEEASEARKKASTPEAQAAAERLYKEAAKGRSEKAMRSMIELAKSDLPITQDELDKDPFLLNCQNGIIDLKTGKLLPHAPEYNITKIAGASYEPTYKFKLFDKFLKQITCDDRDLATYFRDICGMASIGKVFHEGMCIFYGNGQNGKSTFVNTIRRVFGDYAWSISPEMLMVQKDGRQPMGIVQIDGKRFVAAMETEEGRRLSGAMLKQLASADPITGRDLYQKNRTFMPTHTLVLSTNFLPKISSTDVGTWRRIIVVPFKASIPEAKQVKDFTNMLYEQDGNAILSWIIDGARAFIANDYKVNVPKAVEETTKQYRESEDWLGNFIHECCELGDYKVMGGELYDQYVEWCLKNNETYKRRPRDFAAALEASGFDKRKTMHGAEWHGLKLLLPSEQYLNKYHTVKPYRQQAILDDDELDDATRSRM